MTVSRRLRMTAWLPLIITVALLAGCAAIGPAPVRDLLIAGQHPEPGYGAYGYLLFARRPDSADAGRYAAACRAYLNSLDPVTDRAYEDHERGNLMPTYWLLTGTLPEGSPMDDCAQLLEAYDYARAKPLLSAVGKLTARGPLLVAWSTHRPASDQQALILDLSDFADQDFGRAFGIWQDRIVREPSVWMRGFNLVLAREAFRNFIQTYGDRIVEVVTASFG